MDYNKRQAKERREVWWSIVVVITCILIYVGYAYATRMAIGWAKPDFKISEFRDKDANIVGRTYELEQQQALFEALQVAVDEAYIEGVGGKKRLGFQLVTAFSETFSQDLVVTISTKPKTPHNWERKFTREEVDVGVPTFGGEVGEALARVSTGGN